MINNSPELICIAKIVVKKDKLNEALAVFADLKNLSPQEPGCLRYELLQDADNQFIFTFVDKFKDTKAFEYHCEQVYTKKYFDKILPSLTESIEISTYHEIQIK
jgi:quinol monooxygenase YgiN